MKIIEAKTYEDMSRKAANIISAQVIMKPNCVLGLATGGTPVGIYKQLIDWYRKGDIDFSEVTTINLDEYRGLPRESIQSCWTFMHEHFFDHVNIRPENINLPDGTNQDAQEECARYDRLIMEKEGIDLQLLGIGRDGKAVVKCAAAVRSRNQRQIVFLIPQLFQRSVSPIYRYDTDRIY